MPYIYIYIYGFTVESCYRHSDIYNDLPLVDFETLEEHFPPDEYGLYICMGYTHMNSVRERIFSQALAKGYEILNYIHPAAMVETDDIGIGNIILPGAIIEPFCKIGDGNIFKSGAHLAHHSTVKNYNFFAVESSVAGKVSIDNNCFFGNNCTVRDGVHIADRTLVGAGCYISNDTQADGVYVPARSVYLQNKKSIDFI